ncbi:hypothetical protein FRC14_007848 [Serendipita sp. 396]|nr:hypothetical protein FRC14_007848 [Serendipita sp. 396]KAG8827617.1 hypothetical protein FRC19_001862 [Serendipita sp. 401]
MTATSSSKDNGRSHKGKRRSVSDATSPTDEMTGTANGIEHPGSGRSGKRSRDDTEDTIEEKRPRGAKKAQRAVDESDMIVDGEADGEDEGGETRCVCGKSDGDEGGLMVMCEGCKVWQHVHCMDLAEEDVPDHYYCEECKPELHIELLKKLASAKTQRRPRRRSSATRTMGKPLSPSPSPSVQPTKALGKRRNTMNSRATTYEEEIALALEVSRKEANENDDDEDERPATFISRKRAKKSAPASAPEPESPAPPPKRSRSASVTSEFAQPIPDATPVPETLDVPEQPMPEPSDEEAAPAPPAPTRGKGRGGLRKGTRKFPTPSVIDEHDDAPSRTGGRGRQPNQYTPRRGGPGKRGGGHHGAHETSKRINNPPNNKAVRPASPPPFLTTWHLPDHLAHLQSHLPSEIPEPITIRNGPKSETIQERGVKVKWPTKRMTVGDMNKRVRNMLEYVTREQALHIERQTRVAALEDAISSGRYQPITPEPTDLMDVDALPLIQDEDVKLNISIAGEDPMNLKQTSLATLVNRSSLIHTPDNPTIAWMKMSTEEMLADLVSGLIAFQDRYRPRNRRHLAATT